MASPQRDAAKLVGRVQKLRYGGKAYVPLHDEGLLETILEQSGGRATVAGVEVVLFRHRDPKELAIFAKWGNAAEKQRPLREEEIEAFFTSQARELSGKMVKKAGPAKQVDHCTGNHRPEDGQAECSLQADARCCCRCGTSERRPLPWNPLNHW